MTPLARLIAPASFGLILALAGCGVPSTPAEAAPDKPKVSTMQIYYLEIVTKDVDAVCAAYAAATGAKFGMPDAGLGNARTAPMPGGELAGVRAPLRETEVPVTRPYWLVDDIEAAVAVAE